MKARYSKANELPWVRENIATFQSFAVIIRCIHDRGELQQVALAELNRRGLWLSAEQKKQAGLA